MHLLLYTNLKQFIVGTLEFEEFVDCMLTLTRKTEEFELLQKQSTTGAGGDGSKAKVLAKDLNTFLLEAGEEGLRFFSTDND